MLLVVASMAAAPLSLRLICSSAPISVYISVGNSPPALALCLSISGCEIFVCLWQVLCIGPAADSRNAKHVGLYLYQHTRHTPHTLVCVPAAKSGTSACEYALCVDVMRMEIATNYSG